MERPILAFLWDANFPRGGWMDVFRDRHGRTHFFHSSDEARETATEEADHRGARWFSLQIVNLETGEILGGGPIMGDPNRIPQHRQCR